MEIGTNKTLIVSQTERVHGPEQKPWGVYVTLEWPTGQTCYHEMYMAAGTVQHRAHPYILEIQVKMGRAKIKVE